MLIPSHPPCFHQNVRTGSGAGTWLVVHSPPSSAHVPIEWSYVYVPSAGTTAPLPSSFPPTAHPTPPHTVPSKPTSWSTFTHFETTFPHLHLEDGDSIFLRNTAPTSHDSTFTVTVEGTSNANQYRTSRFHKNGMYTVYAGTAVAQWLRCCATNRKVAGSIPASVSAIIH
jgi:hypothetical protein